LKNDIAAESILLFCIIMWFSTVNFIPLSLKIKFLWSSKNNWKFNIFALFERHAYNFGPKFCSYFKNNVLSDSIFCIFIMMWLSTINFTPLSLKIKFLWSSENGRNFNIFDNASTFGLEFCNCLKDDNTVESILLFCIIMWLSTVNFTPLSLKIKFLWSSENSIFLHYLNTLTVLDLNFVVISKLMSYLILFYFLFFMKLLAHKYLSFIIWLWKVQWNDEKQHDASWRNDSQICNHYFYAFFKY